MKTTITIETDNRISIDKILESFRMTKGVKKVETVQSERIPGFAYTHEERLDELKRAEKNIATGKTTDWEKVQKEMETW